MTSGHFVVSLQSVKEKEAWTERILALTHTQVSAPTWWSLTQVRAHTWWSLTQVRAHTWWSLTQVRAHTWCGHSHR